MTSKPGRNDICPCGSGKKYKKCCAEKEQTAALSSFTRASIPGAMQAALQHHNAGRLAEAEALYRQILGVQPNHADALHLSGLIVNQRGEKESALEFISKAIKSSPKQYSFHNSLGIVLSGQGKVTEAIAAIKTSLALNPDFVDGHRNLGKLYFQIGDQVEAANSFKRALGLDSSFAETHNDLANVYVAQGRFDEAIACFQRAVELRPDYAEVYNNIGLLFNSQGKKLDAIAAFQKAIALKPNFAEPYNNLGNVLKISGLLNDAVYCLEQAVAIKPDYAVAYSNLGSALQDQGRLGLAALNFQKALAVQPTLHQALSNWCFVTSYASSITPAEARAEAARYGEMVKCKAGQAYNSWQCARQPQRLRVGLVSGDLRSHPVGFFLKGLLDHADSNRIEFVAYPSHTATDELSEQLSSRMAGWMPIYGKSDQQAARQIRDDGIHVLIDLSGYTDHTRLPMFCLKPAPVQATWLGYFGTTGLAEIDYLIGDPHVTPPDEENHFVEKIWRLPETYLCFSPPDVEIKCNSLPALENGYITFGCFNHLTKMNDAVVALWAQVLTSVPNSRLFLKTKALFDETLRANTLARFASHGIGSDRLLMEANSPRAELLAAYHRVDIALDPFPYPGGTTSAESLWMGVPVLNLCGESFLFRQGVGFLSNAGLSEWVAASPQEYAEKTAAFAADMSGLSQVRIGLRAQVEASPIMDGARFAQSFQALLQGLSA